MVVDYLTMRPIDAPTYSQVLPVIDCATIMSDVKLRQSERSISTKPAVENTYSILFDMATSGS